MKLLTFAHRAEASYFIKEDGYHICDFDIADLYTNQNSLLLITGEGLQSTTEKVTAVCCAFRKEIKSVTNLGIAATFDPKLSIGSVVPVRTCYLGRNFSMEFKSFGTSHLMDPNAYDCVSLDYRATGAESVAYLRNFAALIDREAWAIGSVCDLLKLPFSVYKLISDRVGDNPCKNFITEKKEIESYATSLYQYTKNVKRVGEMPTKDASSLLDQDFYFTTSQSRRYRSLMKSLKLKLGTEKEIHKSVGIDLIRSMKTSPKNRTNLLLAALNDVLNPINTKIRQRLASLTRELSDVGCRVQFSEDYRDDAMNLSLRIDRKEQLQGFIHALQGLPYDEIIKVLNGKIDV